MTSKKPSIDTGLIRELAEVMSDNDINEIEIEMENDEVSIRLSRGMGGDGMMMMAPPAQPMVQAAPAPAPAVAAPAAAPVPEAAPAETASDAGGTAVPSPMVGTAYHSPAPGADAFVKVGQSVRKGQTIMIVEAMKTMNQIPSPADGVVAAIDVEDGQPVEYGETLITLK